MWITVVRENEHKGSGWLLLPSATKLQKGDIFTSVCQEFRRQGGVCLNTCWDTHPLGRNPPGQTPPQADPPADTPLQADTPLPADTPHPQAGDGYCSGRYASYWNVFLFAE